MLKESCGIVKQSFIFAITSNIAMADNVTQTMFFSPRLHYISTRAKTFCGQGVPIFVIRRILRMIEELLCLKTKIPNWMFVNQTCNEFMEIL